MSEPYGDVVARVARMVHDEDAQALVRARGLQLLGMTWEDAARYKHSAVGPNISDMTIQVEQAGDPGDPPLSCMPVIRAPNFHDRSGDIAPELFQLLVGNAEGDTLHAVTLRALLEDLPRFLHAPGLWIADSPSLLAPRDTHVLVSAQACLLPVPRRGLAEFTPVLFNYASREGDPAVLTILASREGTSITAIDPGREPGSRLWGQRLYFNDDGRRCVFTGQRLSDFEAAAGGLGDAADGDTLSRVLLVQVPLRTRHGEDCGRAAAIEDEAPFDRVYSSGPADSGLEAAVIGHSASRGPFVETDGLPLVRDPRYPIRVTVQFYQATSTGELSEAEVQRMAAQIERVYSDAAHVGSLVSAGETGRATEYDGDKVEPPDWWARFWAEAAPALPLSQRAALARLRAALGADLAGATPEQAAALLQQPADD